MILVLASPAGAADPGAQQDKLKARDQRVQAQLNLAKASDGKVEAEADRLAGAVAAQSGRAASARTAAEAATARLLETQRRLDETAARTAVARRAIVALAVQSYMHPYQRQLALLSGIVANGIDVGQIARGDALITSVIGRDTDVIDAYRQDGLDLADAGRALERVRSDADARAKAASDEATRLATFQAAAGSVHAELTKRIAGLQDESRQLGAQESQLTAVIQSRRVEAEAALARDQPVPSNSTGTDARGASPGSGRRGVLTWPVQGPVSSEYGPRWGGFHPGIDIAPPYGTPIHAAARGVVIFAGVMGAYGNLVVIDHGGGLVTEYAHQSRMAVAQGQVVNQGAVIGYEGSTGASTGPHVHFEVRLNGATQNPRSYTAGTP